MADISTDTWKIIPGTNPVLLVASHNYPQIRGFEIKVADIGTGDLVQALCQETNAWGIISTAVQQDPNWYKSSQFRDQVKKIIEENKIKAAVDIHGRRESYQYLVEYFPNKTYKNKYFPTVKNSQIGEFHEDGQLTLCEDLDQQNIPGLEIEIRRDGRDPESQAYQQIFSQISGLIAKL